MCKLKSFLLIIGVILLSSYTLYDNTPPTDDKFVIVLDAGHGGHDPGRPTNLGYTEKEIALKIVLQVGKELEKNPDIKVIYTRKTDVFVKLRERARIANKADADLFVSIHCNAHHTQASGTETFVVGVGNTNRNLNIAKEENEVIFLEDDHEEHYEGFDPSSPVSLIGLTLMQEEYVDQSLMLANLIETNFSKLNKRKSRGVKQDNLWVMHNTYMPSVLIETGFITNRTEGAYLNSKAGQQQISSSIVTSIIEYKQNIGKGSVVPEIAGVNDNVSVDNGIIFKVQLAASSKNLPLKSYNFKGLTELSKVQQGTLYKYFSGNTNDYSIAEKIKKTAVKKGYTSCFVVAYKDGVKVPLSVALKN